MATGKPLRRIGRHSHGFLPARQNRSGIYRSRQGDQNMPFARLGMLPCTDTYAGVSAPDPACSVRRQFKAPVLPGLFVMARVLKALMHRVGGSNPGFGYEKAPISVGALFFLFGAPGRIRTSDRLARSQVLYPADLRAHDSSAYWGQH